VLELFSVANIATKFRAVELSMSLKFSKGLPDNLSSSVLSVTFMWELTEINTVFKNFIDLLHEVASSLAVWTANVIAWSFSILSVTTSSCCVDHIVLIELTSETGMPSIPL
jgi:hypothetical protein